MPNYRRAFVPGGCWFFTVNLLERRNTLLIDRIDALRDAMEKTRGHHAFVIDAIVVLLSILLSDLLYYLVDPRINLESMEEAT